MCTCTYKCLDPTDPETTTFQSDADSSSRMKFLVVFIVLIQTAIGFRYPSPINYYNYNSNNNDPEPVEKSVTRALSPEELAGIQKLIEKSIIEIKELPEQVMKKKYHENWQKSLKLNPRIMI